MDHAVAVLIPLHRSERFAETVQDNIRALVDEVQVVVSDPTEHDGLLAELSGLWAGHPNVTFFGRRLLGGGWVAHYNDLLVRCQRPYFMWLPHDDTIEADYVMRCREALLARPDVVGAYGRLVPVEGPGLDLVELPPWPQPTVGGTPAEAVTAVTSWYPGVAFRSVFRREAVNPLPVTPVDGRWADVVWMFSMMSSHRLVAVPAATYRKRWYAESTHRQWPNADHRPLLAPLLVAELVHNFPGMDLGNEVERLVRWVEDDLRSQRGPTHCDGDLLRAALEQVTHERNQARALVTSLRSSRSWRVGQLIARLAHRLRPWPR